MPKNSNLTLITRKTRKNIKNADFIKLETFDEINYYLTCEFYHPSVNFLHNFKIIGKTDCIKRVTFKGEQLITCKYNEFTSIFNSSNKFNIVNNLFNIKFKCSQEVFKLLNGNYFLEYSFNYVIEEPCVKPKMKTTKINNKLWFKEDDIIQKCCKSNKHIIYISLKQYQINIDEFYDKTNCKTQVKIKLFNYVENKFENFSKVLSNLYVDYTESKIPLNKTELTFQNVGNLTFDMDYNNLNCSNYFIQLIFN